LRGARLKEAMRGCRLDCCYRDERYPRALSGSGERALDSSSSCMHTAAVPASGQQAQGHLPLNSSAQIISSHRISALDAAFQCSRCQLLIFGPQQFIDHARCMHVRLCCLCILLVQKNSALHQVRSRILPLRCDAKSMVGCNFTK
jgi:hypothetical protein